MKTLDIENIRSDYLHLFHFKALQVIEIRKNLRVTQFEMSYKIGVSLKTIQNFENHRCFDSFLIFAYRELLNPKPL